MGEQRKYKWFSIEKEHGKRWHIGAFFCKDDDQIYLMLDLFKWNIYIGKLIDWDSVW